MDAHRTTIARACLDAAQDGTRSFPQIAGALLEAGFEGYAVDYRRNTTTYFLPEGDSVVLANHPSARPVSPDFDTAGLVSQIRWAQSNAPDYSYKAFSDNVRAFGCAGYIVSFKGRRVLYYGRSAETHVEHFPQ